MQICDSMQDVHDIKNMYYLTPQQIGYQVLGIAEVS